MVTNNELLLSITREYEEIIHKIVCSGENMEVMEQKYIASRFDKTSSAVKVAPQPEPEPEPAPPTTNIDGLLTKAGRDEIDKKIIGELMDRIDNVSDMVGLVDAV
jgi:predicted ATP-grasp superfamily ATP-dependent carboligase|tara:strand:+ start:139 stop:453 length:315 start_codon:yes stop_codon:yes gene_type:complete